MRFIIFERSHGHCHITLLSADTMAAALSGYIAEVMRHPVDTTGYATVDGGSRLHSLEYIEREFKANTDFDELALDEKTGAIINENSFEIRVLPDDALKVNCASVFTSAEPAYTAGEIAIARAEFEGDFGNSNARAFFWYVRNGILVTFHAIGNSSSTLNVTARYLVTRDGCRRWSGSHDEIIEAMTFEFPYSPA
jgi:hypothetical protein